MCGLSRPPRRREAPGCSPVIGGFVLPQTVFRPLRGAIRSPSVTKPSAPHLLPPRGTCRAAPFGPALPRRYDASRCDIRTAALRTECNSRPRHSGSTKAADGHRPGGRPSGARFVGDVMDFGTQGPEAPADLAWLRGVDAYTMGAYPQAEEEFRAAVRMDPGMADGWLGLHALRVDTTTALLRMFRHRDRFGEQRSRHRRTLNSWYWLGWWVQPVLESPRDLLLAHASHWLDGRHVPELDRALAGLPPVDTDPQVRFLHACRAYLVKDWEQLVRHTDPLIDDPMLGIEAGLFGGMARVRLEMFGQAEPLLSSALMRCRSEQPQRKELRYWLARAHEGTGRSAAALPLYRAVHRVDPAFMDTSARLAAISEGDGYDERRPTSRRSRSPGSARTCWSGPDGVDPLFGGEGRDLKLSEPELPPPGALPSEADRVREKAVVPVQSAASADRADRSGTARRGARRAGAHGRPGTGEAPSEGAVRAVEHGAAAGRAGSAGPAAEAALRLLGPLRHRQDDRGPHPRPGLLRARAARRRPSGGGPAGRPGGRVPRPDRREGQRADRLRDRRRPLRRRGLLALQLRLRQGRRVRRRGACRCC